MRTLFILAGVCLAAATAQAQSADEATEAQPIVVNPNTISWGPAPAILPKGAKAAVIEGDPGKPGLFTLRLALPADYRIPPHYHPVWEHVTVIEGSFKVGMGEKFDTGNAVTLATGGFGALPPGMRHFAWTTEPTVLQIHAEGPWRLVYVNPADDPSAAQ